MTPIHEMRQALRALVGDDPLVYVDCGARAGKLPKEFRAIEGTLYVGFEADAGECARLNEGARAGQRYVCAFLGRAGEHRPFHVTTSPACSSLLMPDLSALQPFGDLVRAFTVERTFEVETITLDEALAREGIAGADFLELDTQGSELDILAASPATLHRHVLGAKVEVEFSPMYAGQPLFADIDTFMRGHGFQLFDLSRYRVRRAGLDASVASRGQLLWGHALYLRRADGLGFAAASRLAAVAALVGLPDYAFQVLDRLFEADAPDDLRQRARRVRDLLPHGFGDPENPTLLASRHRAQWRD